MKKNITFILHNSNCFFAPSKKKIKYAISNESSVEFPIENISCEKNVTLITFALQSFTTFWAKNRCNLLRSFPLRLFLCLYGTT
jgi:hypothetical protein